MIDVSQGTKDEYLRDDHIGGLYVEFDEADGGYVLGNTEIVEESLELDESMASTETFKFNGANASAIQFSFSKESSIGNMDIVGKKFTVYHYVRLKQDDPVFINANSLFGGDRLSNNAERLKPYIEQAIDQLDEENQGLERYYGHGPKIFLYDWEYQNYKLVRREKDPETQEWYDVYEIETKKRTGSYTYITPSTAIDSGQLYFTVNKHRTYLWANTKMDISAQVDTVANEALSVLPPDYTTQQINILTDITYTASYYPSMQPITDEKVYLLDLKLLLVDTTVEPFDDGSYKLRILQQTAAGTNTGSSTEFIIPEGGALEAQRIITLKSNCSYLIAYVVGKNGIADMQLLSSDGEMAYTACNIYPVNLIPLGEFKVDSCPVVFDNTNTRTLKAYDGLYSKALDEKVTVSSEGVNTIGDVLDNFVTPSIGIEFGGEKYALNKEVEFLSTSNSQTYTATYPDGTTEMLELATGHYEIIDYSQGYNYDLIKKTYEDEDFATRLIYDFERKYGIRQKVTQWDDDGNVNPLFDHDYYRAYTSIRNAIGAAGFSTPSGISANGRFTIPVVKSMTITPATESAAHMEVLDRKGVSANGKIDMSDPIVPLVDDLLYGQQDWRYLSSAMFYIRAGHAEPDEVAPGGSIKKNGTRFYFNLTAPSTRSIYYGQETFTFKGNFNQPVTVTFATAAYRIYVMVDDRDVFWQFANGDKCEIKISEYAKNMTNGVMDKIRKALFKGNIIDGQGNVYNSSDSSVLSSLENYIKDHATMSDFTIQGGDGLPYPDTRAYFDFQTPLAYYVTRYSGSSSEETETRDYRVCNIAGAQEWHNTVTLFEKAVTPGSSYTTTPRELIGAYAELNGLLFMMDRAGDPQLVKLPAPIHGGTWYPDDNIYPADDLFPGNEGFQMFIMNDSVLDIAYENTDLPIKYGGVKIYKNGVLVLTRYLSQSGITVDDPEDRVFYEVRDNVFIDKYQLSAADLIEIADMINGNIYELEIYNINANIIGLPFMTLGDMISLEYNDTTIYVLNRKLKGVMALYDNMRMQYKA